MEGGFRDYQPPFSYIVELKHKCGHYSINLAQVNWSTPEHTAAVYAVGLGGEVARARRFDGKQYLPVNIWWNIWKERREEIFEGKEHDSKDQVEGHHF